MNLHPVASLLPPLDQAQRDALRDSIVSLGVLDPVVVDEDGQIVDGRNRAEIAREYHIDYPTRPLPDGVSPWAYGLTVNLDRRHMTAEQRAAVILLAEREGLPDVARIRERAAERQSPGRGGIEDHVILDSEAGRAHDAIGQIVGVSGATVRRVERAARERPEALVEIAAGTTTSREVVAPVRLAPAPVEHGPDPHLEFPCPTCGRWTPQWVLVRKMKQPEGATWRWLGLRGSGKTRRPKSKAVA